VPNQHTAKLLAQSQLQGSLLAVNPQVENPRPVNRHLKNANSKKCQAAFA
jgi:hypothetical protein